MAERCNHALELLNSLGEFVKKVEDDKLFDTVEKDSSKISAISQKSDDWQIATKSLMIVRTPSLVSYFSAIFGYVYILR